MRLTVAADLLSDIWEGCITCSCATLTKQIEYQAVSHLKVTPPLALSAPGTSCCIAAAAAAVAVAAAAAAACAELLANLPVQPQTTCFLDKRMSDQMKVFVVLKTGVCENAEQTDAVGFPSTPGSWVANELGR